MTPHLHRAPADCPVCGQRLAVSRLGCPGCGTELVGSFASCPYCALSDADLDLLRVFLSSRGNLKEVEKHLGVSYPTARARFSDLLERLGMAGEDPGAGLGDADDAAAASAAQAPERDVEAQGRVRDGEGRDDSGTPRVGDAVRDQVLAQVAAGTLAPDVAADLLARL